MRKSSIIVVGLILLFFIGKCIYFVGGVSATIPPIKTYIYRGSVKQFYVVLEKYALSDSDSKVRILPRGDIINGGRWIDIEMVKNNANVTYSLTCSNVKNGNTSNSEIELTYAGDITHNTGGYGIAAVSIKPFLNTFESILADLKKNQRIIINPKPASFSYRFHY